MDYFLKKNQDEKSRKSRIRKFIENSFPQHNNENPLVFNLEIGCGHGHWLSEFAEAADSQVFIGIDLITKRIEKAINKIKKRKIINLHFIKAEAIEFLTFMPDYLKIENCYLMYPDPWPKAKHFKRRLFQQPLLEILFLKSTPKGKIFFMTDFEPYFDWSIQNVEKSNNWKITEEPWPHDSSSFFSELLPNNRFFCAQKHKSF